MSNIKIPSFGDMPVIANTNLDRNAQIRAIIFTYLSVKEVYATVEAFITSLKITGSRAGSQTLAAQILFDYDEINNNNQLREEYQLTNRDLWKEMVKVLKKRGYVMKGGMLVNITSEVQAKLSFTEEESIEEEKEEGSIE